MADPVAAARALGQQTTLVKGTYEAPGTLDPSGADGWVATGAIVHHPELDRVAMVRTRWSGDEWVLPGGGAEAEDGSLEETVHREVREKTGLSVDVNRPLVVERQTFVAPDDPALSTTGWFALIACTATDSTVASDPGEDEDEINAVEWHENPTEAFADISDAIRPRLRAEVDW